MLFGPNSDIGVLPDGLTVDLRDVAAYCVLAAECGGRAVQMVHNEKRLQTKVYLSYITMYIYSQMKGLTKEGAAEFVTHADLVSNKIIVDLMAKYPGITVCLCMLITRSFCIACK